ncbi:hypothetical protein Ssi03_34370 [Sphaerisporangium siamense]|uniref:Sortase (Surface protein transpeptidase) n=1 Tax=Sphaerisporangium siamense TaxID=795645 RepID=A0A7W7D3V7_9ACTN|nr:class F sortase [Sphaerisporangium siamense]MBB4698493.1 sortase (surface protein transpeptidase) [Sphaerisporangium siamense]GII85447.1 hypothetical protein Ssi03_34370 [Sphaerisporangium siamense]
MSAPMPPEDAPREARWKAALAPVVLTVGSLAGVGAVMVGLLMYLSPVQENASNASPDAARVARMDAAGDPGSSGGTAGDPGLSGGTSGTNPVGVQVADPAAAAMATVGPGGANVPLVEAAPTAPPPSPAAAVPAKPLRKAAPVRVKIPSIGVDAALVSLGVDKSGEIQVPSLSRPKLAGWYRLGPAPGEMGPAVILGHVNTRKGPAVFSRLRELGRGAVITVVRSDGSSARFTVDGAEQASKNRFPTKRVYGHVDRPSLRLITCGGIFNPRAHSYTDNIIIYATLTSAARR